MNNLRFLFLLLAVLAFSACEDENPIPAFDGPTVTAPSGITTVANAATAQSVTFTVSFDADLTATYTATGSGVTVTNPTGTVAGQSVIINFDAGTNAGAASITLTITDAEGQSASGTAVLQVDADPNLIRVAANIDADETWIAGKTYVLGGRISVTAGACLTIEPGVIIKGEAGTGPNATALLVARGGKLIAEGTADVPIIFTSIADEITPEDVAAGNFESPNLDPDINGLWGGVIVLGRARISANNGDEDNPIDVNELQIEGIPTSDTNGLYGGDDDMDNSGTLRYISIRHGGSNIGAGNEINGLTLGGVGSGTTIEHVEVVANQDDGIEWFGGTVDITNAVVWNAGDDAIDTDQAWSGTLDNFVVINAAGSLFELDGPEGSSYTARHTIRNGSVKAIFAGRLTGGSLIDCDGNTPVDMSNVHFVAPLFFLDDDDNVIRYTITNDEFDDTSFNNVTFDTEGEDIITVMEKPGDPIPAGVSAGGTPQADISGLGWTWAAKSGGFEGL
jgi:hypothetical protein